MAVRKIRGSWWVDIRLRGRRHRKMSPENSREGALAFEYQYRRTARQFANLPPEARKLIKGEVRFREFAGIWLIVYVKPHLSRSTFEGYVAVLRRSLVKYFGAMRLDDIDEAPIDAFMHREKVRGASAKTINNALGILRRCLATAKRWHLIDEVPDVRMLKVPPPKFDYLTPSESRLLLKAAEGTRWWLMLLCALHTGMRASELMALRWEDVDLETGTVHVRRGRFHGVEKAPKNNRVRHLPLTQELWSALASPGRKDGYVFVGRDGGPLTWDAAYRGLRACCAKAGLRPVGLHVLRHSFASQLAMGGVDLLPIQMLLGHSTIQVTTRYAHLPHAALRLSVQTLTASDRQIDGHQMGTAIDCATLPAPEGQAHESADAITKTPSPEEKELVVARRGFEPLIFSVRGRRPGPG
jgi:integrase